MLKRRSSPSHQDTVGLLGTGLGFTPYALSHRPAIGDRWLIDRFINNTLLFYLNEKEDRTSLGILARELTSL